MGLSAAAIYKFVWHINLKLFLLFVFVLGSIAIEIRTLNAVKRHTYFVSLAPLLPSRTQVRFFFCNSVEQVVGKISDPGTC